MKHLGIDLSAADIAELIKVMDANGDGSIDWNEFDAVFGDSADSRKGGSTRQTLCSYIIDVLPYGC
eukprot:SAG31_NODE_6993_length_1825_cov_1.440904_2_plen_66_part_00